jgi:hypothetical protein
MGKQLVNFITCGCESSAPFFVIKKPGANPRRIGDMLQSKKQNKTNQENCRVFCW